METSRAKCSGVKSEIGNGLVPKEKKAEALRSSPHFASWAVSRRSNRTPSIGVQGHFPDRLDLRARSLRLLFFAFLGIAWALLARALIGNYSLRWSL